MIETSIRICNARAAHVPVVALESTLITHGFERPMNVEVAHALEEAVRDEGAEPATIAMLEGRPVAGLSIAQIRNLGGNANAQKASLRDLPLYAARGITASTTVAASIFLAKKAGFEVFATGGIGGVHRGDFGDISADLPCLAETSIISVCAGAKSILDLPRTREWLETNGITVLGWQTDDFPAFFSRASGLSVDARVECEEEVAAVWREKNLLGLKGALLVVVPPPEEAALEASMAEGAIAVALERAAKAGVRGKDLTPFLLREVAQESGGNSVAANKALLLNNARIAARIARVLAHC